MNVHKTVWTHLKWKNKIKNINYWLNQWESAFMLIDDFIVHSKDIIYGCVFKSFNFSFHNFKKLTIFLGLSTKIIDIKKKIRYFYIHFGFILFKTNLRCCTLWTRFITWGPVRTQFKWKLARSEIGKWDYEGFYNIVHLISCGCKVNSQLIPS